MHTRLIVQEARTLTDNKLPGEAATALHAAGWQYIGSGAYKAGFMKGHVVVKICAAAVVRADACIITEKSFYNTEHPHEGWGCGDILRFQDKWARMTMEQADWDASENAHFFGVRMKLPSSVKSYLAPVFFVQGWVICQLAAPNPTRDDCTNRFCKNYSALRSHMQKLNAQGVYCGDVSVGHNHGHLPDGRVVIFDGL